MKKYGFLLYIVLAAMPAAGQTIVPLKNIDFVSLSNTSSIVYPDLRFFTKKDTSYQMFEIGFGHFYNVQIDTTNIGIRRVRDYDSNSIAVDKIKSITLKRLRKEIESGQYVFGEKNDYDDDSLITIIRPASPSQLSVQEISLKQDTSGMYDTISNKINLLPYYLVQFAPKKYIIVTEDYYLIPTAEKMNLYDAWDGIPIMYVKQPVDAAYEKSAPVHIAVTDWGTRECDCKDDLELVVDRYGYPIISDSFNDINDDYNLFGVYYKGDNDIYIYNNWVKLLNKKPAKSIYGLTDNIIVALIDTTQYVFDAFGNPPTQQEIAQSQKFDLMLGLTHYDTYSIKDDSTIHYNLEHYEKHVIQSADFVIDSLPADMKILDFAYDDLHSNKTKYPRLLSTPYSILKLHIKLNGKEGWINVHLWSDTHQQYDTVASYKELNQTHKFHAASWEYILPPVYDSIRTLPGFTPNVIDAVLLYKDGKIGIYRYKEDALLFSSIEDKWGMIRYTLLNGKRGWLVKDGWYNEYSDYPDK